jgi:hypothetical protein
MKANSTDVVPANDGGIGPDAGAPADMGARILVPRTTALRGLITFVNTIDGPRNTSSSHSTPV